MTTLKKLLFNLMMLASVGVVFIACEGEDGLDGADGVDGVDGTDGVEEFDLGRVVGGTSSGEGG